MAIRDDKTRLFDIALRHVENISGCIEEVPSVKIAEAIVKDFYHPQDQVTDPGNHHEQE